MANPCDDAYAGELADAYLTTAIGGTIEDPSGYWCTAGDVTQWKVVVARVRKAILDSINANPGVELPKDLRGRLSWWLIQSFKTPSGGFFPHVVTRICNEDVSKSSSFAALGVSYLSELHCVIAQQDGKILAAPPKTIDVDEGLPGPDALWYLGGGLVALALIVYAVKG